jgi:DNA topoisomerase-1
MEILFGGAKGELSYDEKHYETGIVRIATTYRHIKNKKPVTDQELTRIKALKIPPSLKHVWISGDPKTDIQVVGVDAKGRKQYRYSDKYLKMAERRKFMRMFEFIKQLPRLNKIMGQHKSLSSYSKNHVITTMIKLVQDLHFRVGKEQYAKQNKSYGVSSLNKVHIKIQGDMIQFRFMGKSKQQLQYTYHNQEIANHLKILRKLTGIKIFQYVDETGNVKRVTDMDLNEYIQTNMGDEFTIKDFRTYAANYHFIEALLEEINFNGNTAVKKNITTAFKVASEKLSHTVSIAKKAYIMPFTINLYMEHPEFFVARRDDNPKKVLIDVLNLYKKS